MAAVLLIEDGPVHRPAKRPSRRPQAPRQRGAGEPKCGTKRTRRGAFWGDRASLTGASSWLVRWDNRDEALSLRQGTVRATAIHRSLSGTVRKGTNSLCEARASEDARPSVTVACRGKKRRRSGSAMPSTLVARRDGSSRAR